MNDADPHVELKRDMAQTREVTERLSAALDRELREQSERSKVSGAERTRSDIERDLADATARFQVVQERERAFSERVNLAMSRFDFSEIQSLQAESEALQDEVEPIQVEIAELQALLDECRRSAGQRTLVQTAALG